MTGALPAEAAAKEMTMNTQLDTHEYAFVIFTDYCKEGYELEPQLAVIDEEAIRARCATHVESIQRALKALQDAHDTTDGTIAQIPCRALHTRTEHFHNAYRAADTAVLPPVSSLSDKFDVSAHSCARKSCARPATRRQDR